MTDEELTAVEQRCHDAWFAFWQGEENDHPAYCMNILAFMHDDARRLIYALREAKQEIAALKGSHTHDA